MAGVTHASSALVTTPIADRVGRKQALLPTGVSYVKDVRDVRSRCTLPPVPVSGPTSDVVVFSKRRGGEPPERVSTRPSPMFIDRSAIKSRRKKLRPMIDLGSVGEEVQSESRSVKRILCTRRYSWFGLQTGDSLRVTFPTHTDLTHVNTCTHVSPHMCSYVTHTHTHVRT